MIFSEKKAQSWLKNVLNKDVTEESLSSTFEDGTAIVAIIQHFKLKVPDWPTGSTPTSRMGIISFTYKCLQTLTAAGHNLTLIMPEDLIDGDTTQIVKMVEILSRKSPQDGGKSQTARPLSRSATLQPKHKLDDFAEHYLRSNYGPHKIHSDERVVILTRDDAKLLKWVSIQCNIDITAYETFSDGFILAFLVQLLSNQKIDRDTIQDFHDMTVRERLSHAAENAEEKFGIEDILVRANIASPRNLLGLKKFLTQLKEKSQLQEDARKSATAKLDKRRDVSRSIDRLSSSNHVGSKAQTRSAQFSREIDQYAENAYPLPQREEGNNMTGYEQVSLDVTPYRKSKDNLKPVDDAVDSTEQTQKLYTDLEQFEQSIREQKSNLQSPKPITQQSTGTGPDMLITPKELNHVPDELTAKHETLEHHLSYLYEPIPYKGDPSVQNGTTHRDTERGPPSVYDESPSPINDVSSLTVPKPEQHYYDFLTREQARKTAIDAQKQRPRLSASKNNYNSSPTGVADVQPIERPPRLFDNKPLKRIMKDDDWKKSNGQTFYPHGTPAPPAQFQ